MTAATKSACVAQEFVDACRNNDWKIDLNCGIVQIRKQFAPGDSSAYAECDGQAFHLLAMVPLRGGSVWGTDGGSVGGAVGLRNGFYELKKSGSGSRFIKAVAKILAK
jgi:hypothetical protein